MLTLFRPPKPAISRLLLFDLSPENFEKPAKFSMNSITDFRL